jgi:hypothetical protein
MLRFTGVDVDLATGLASHFPHHVHTKGIKRTSRHEGPEAWEGARESWIGCGTNGGSFSRGVYLRKPNDL